MNLRSTYAAVCEGRLVMLKAEMHARSFVERFVCLVKLELMAISVAKKFGRSSFARRAVWFLVIIA